jgi:novobiocin biosynthesis protein NovU/D-mycarose 3-C-methyltransferase
LAQLAEVVDPEILYSSYAYVTSSSHTMDAHLDKQCLHLIEAGNFKRVPKVLEIASNTGLYLKKFQAQGCNVLGVEPAKNIAALAVESGVPTNNVFFDFQSARDIKANWGTADVVCGRHVFAHIDDWQSFVADLEAITHDRSVVALEMPYLVDFLEKTEFDTIYHEHLSYVSVRAAEAMVSNSSFRLQQVDHSPIHGGSILVQLRRREDPTPIHTSVSQYLAREHQLKINQPATWSKFVGQVRYIRKQLPTLIRGLRQAGKRVIGYGASAKGNTLLNTCNLTQDDLDYIIDNTPFKQGRVAPGSLVPVVPPERLLEDQPDFALLLAWNFAEEIINRETDYQKRGGRFILPIPEPRIADFQ